MTFYERKAQRIAHMLEIKRAEVRLLRNEQKKLERQAKKVADKKWNKAKKAYALVVSLENIEDKL